MPATPTAPTAQQAAPAAPRESIEAAGEERVVLQQGRTRAVLTNRGAQLVSMLVPEKADPKSGTLELVRKRPGGLYPYALTAARGLQPHPLDQALFWAERTSDGRSVVFRYSGPLGTAEKRFRFDERGLLAVEIRVPGRTDWGVLVGPGVRNPTAEEMKSRFERRQAVYKSAGEVKVVDAQRAEKGLQVSGQSLSWIGLADTYFLSAQVPQAGLGRAVLTTVIVQPPEAGGPPFVPLPPEDQITKEQKALPRELFLVLRPAGDRLSLVSYWGSKEYERLKALPYGLEGTVALGYFGFLARPLIAGLPWIH